MDKIEKIQAKIVRMLDDICEADGFVQKKDEPRYDALAEVFDFIETLEEEPDESLEEAAERFANTQNKNFLNPEIVKNIFIAGAKWYEEQFEKNRLAHCDAVSQEDCDRETEFAMEIIEKEHRQPTFLDAINYGMRLQKEQMFKDAVEGEIHLVGFNNVIFIKEPRAEILDRYNVGDKIRIIIVKED